MHISKHQIKMINLQLIKVIIILAIVAFSIPTFLMIYGDFKTMAEPEFDENHFSALVTLHVIRIDSEIAFNLFPS